MSKNVKTNKHFKKRSSYYPSDNRTYLFNLFLSNQQRPRNIRMKHAKSIRHIMIYIMIRLFKILSILQDPQQPFFNLPSLNEDTKAICTFFVKLIYSKNYCTLIPHVHILKLYML